MSDEDVAEKAKRDGTTRAVASMEKACELDENNFCNWKCTDSTHSSV